MDVLPREVPWSARSDPLSSHQYSCSTLISIFSNLCSTQAVSEDDLTLLLPAELLLQVFRLLDTQALVLVGQVSSTVVRVCHSGKINTSPPKISKLVVELLDSRFNHG